MARDGLADRVRAAGRDPRAHALAEDVYAVADAVFEEEPQNLPLPLTQYALVYTAAAEIAPTILSRAGMPQTEEHVMLVENLLVVAWSNALVLLDAETLRKVKEERAAQRPEE